MNWSHQALDSLVWLGKAYIISLIGFAIVVAGLGHLTVWGRQIRRLAWPYFAPSRSIKPLLVTALIIFMTLFSVRMNVLISFWYNGFYSAMQQLNATTFWFLLSVFAVLATVHIVRGLLDFYIRQSFMIHWRVWLTQQLIDRWINKQAYYRAGYIAQGIDNPEQRIQQDVDAFVSNVLALTMGLLDAIVSLFAFTLILWGLSGALALFGVEIPRLMVFLVYIYVIVATVFAVWIGRPLVQLNFLNERFNATFRYALIRLREYGESIAFYRGEQVERSNLLQRFAEVIGNMWAIVYRSLKFQGFNRAVSQVAVVFPFLVQAPRLLSKQITLGDVMQTAQAFGQVQGALSFFRTSYDTFASLRAVIDRLTGFLDVIEQVNQLPAVQTIDTRHVLDIKALTVRTPAEVLLVNALALQLSGNDALLIRGHSGVGKTTLLRAIAGLWPYVEGEVRRPLGQALFLPQKPYLPMGTLRAALYYPATIESSDTVAANILAQCQLAHLTSRLDEVADWTRILSLGEQQRLAIGRVLLARPDVVFLDEASSAMDEGLEHAMYQLLRDALPETILVSVGHRSTLRAFHTHELQLSGAGKWQCGPLVMA